MPCRTGMDFRLKHVELDRESDRSHLWSVAIRGTNTRHTTRVRSDCIEPLKPYLTEEERDSLKQPTFVNTLS
jgi:hypothetical protein